MQTTVTAGPGFLSLLTLVFVAAKLFGHIAWSWLWVFSPLWIPLAALLIVAIVGAVFTFIVYASAAR